MIYLFRLIHFVIKTYNGNDHGNGDGSGNGKGDGHGNNGE